MADVQPGGQPLSEAEALKASDVKAADRIRARAKWRRVLNFEQRIAEAASNAHNLTTAQRDLLAEWQRVSSQQFSAYVDSWAAGRIDLATLEQLFKQELKDLYIASTWTAVGDIREALPLADYGLVGRRLRDQYGFMHGFFAEIAAAGLSLALIKARMEMYANSSTQILEQIGISGGDMPALPHYPGDGSTRCRTNCRCGLSRSRVEGGWDIRWELRPAEHCPDCERRSRTVLMVRFGKVVNPEVWS